MTISQNKYINITSGVGGQAQAANRELCLRLITPNVYQTDGVLEFSSAAQVGKFYGFNSFEYSIAQAYFGYVNNYQQSPRKIGFYPDTRSGRSGFVQAVNAPAALAQFKAISDGGFKITLGGTETAVGSLDFSAATSYADVAHIINTAFSGQNLNAGVSFDSVHNAFILNTALQTGVNVAPLAAPAAGTDISGLLGLSASFSPIVSAGVAPQSISELLSGSLSASNNYGTFAFLASDLTTEQMVEAAQWTHAQNLAGGMYIQPLEKNAALALQPLVADYDGVALVAGYGVSSFEWLIPAAVAASTNYNRVNGTMNYMYKQIAGAVASVSDDTDYETLTAAKINFYGTTQAGGAPLSFFQEGVLQGSITDMGVFMNEVYLKDDIAVRLLNYQLAVAKWPANESGKAIGDGIIQGALEVAKNNGTILQGKALTDTQKAYITQLTADGDAWRAVYSEGYYLMSEITPAPTDPAKYEYNYVLLYSKGDSVRKVEGAHTLI